MTPQELTGKVRKHIFGEKKPVDDILHKTVFYHNEIRVTCKQLRAEVDTLHNQWCYCKDHNFEAEALLLRGKYDVLNNTILSIESKFEINE